MFSINLQAVLHVLSPIQYFQISDGKLVWQKLPADKPLFFTAAALVLVATAWTAWSLKNFASPPKN